MPPFFPVFHMNSAHTRSPIAAAVLLTEDAREAAIQSREFGSAFEFRAVSQLLAEDTAVHQSICSRANQLRDALRAILKDGVVTKSEMKALRSMDGDLQSIDKIAQAT